MPYTDKDKRREYLREYKRRNREEINARRRELYAESHPEVEKSPVDPAEVKRMKSKCDARYRAKHKDSIKLRKQIYYQENKETIAKKQLHKYHSDVQCRLAHNLRNRVKQAVLRQYRAGSAVRDLGCSVEDFQKYIESMFSEGMTWENYGEWHLDHIKPLCSFDLADRDQFLLACHYTNYQPLWAVDNLKKNRY